MKIRIRKKSSGLKGYDWYLYYTLEIKTFLFYRTVKKFDSLKDAKEFSEKLGPFYTIVFSR
jgi:hypothetical protein